MHIITDLLMQFSHIILHCCLNLSDYFSKWVEAVATPSKEAYQIASALYKVCTFNSLTCNLSLKLILLVTL